MTQGFHGDSSATCSAILPPPLPRGGAARDAERLARFAKDAERLAGAVVPSEIRRLAEEGERLVLIPLPCPEAGKFIETS